MPDIEQYNWDKLTPQSHEPKLKPQDSERLYWRYKKQEVPKSTNPKHGKPRIKREKMKDLRIFNEIYDNEQHIRSITNEDT